MRFSKTRWLIISLQLATIFSIGIAALAAIIKGLLVPALYWIFNDIWKWMPFNRWLGYVLIGFCGGIMMGVCLTLYMWIQQTSSSVPVKASITIFVVAGTCAFFFGSVSLIKFFIPI